MKIRKSVVNYSTVKNNTRSNRNLDQLIKMKGRHARFMVNKALIVFHLEDNGLKEKL